MPSEAGADATTWRIAPGVAATHTESRVAIINPARPQQPPVILEDSGAFIWRLIEKECADLATASDEVGIPTEELGSFIEGLSRLGLVSRP